MGRAMFAAVLLLAAARSSGEANKDLHLRARLLLRDIRIEARAGDKDVSRLRSQLSALKAENSDKPDDEVTAELKAAEANLNLVESGTPLPPPLPEESVDDGDLRDSVAQPVPAARPPVLQAAAPAVVPETAAPVFDGSIRRGGLAAPAVEPPQEDAEAPLDHYLELTDEPSQLSFVTTASTGLLEKLQIKDEDGKGANMMGQRLHSTIRWHPKRASFIALKVSARKDRSLHLIYRERDGGAVDENLGDVYAFLRAAGGGRVGGGGRKRGKKKGGKPAGDEGGDDDGGGGGGGHGKKGHGRKGHGGGGGGGDGAGPGGSGESGASHHAKALRAAGAGKGGGGMFDGGESDGGDIAGGGAGGGLFSGKGPRGRGRKGKRGAGASAEESSEAASAGPSGSSAFGSGRAHASAGGSLSAEGPGASGSGSRRKGAFVPLPKDFTTRGGGSRLRGDGAESAGGPAGAGLGGFHMSPLGKKEIHKDAPVPTAAPRAFPAPADVASAKPVPAAASPAAAAPAASVSSLVSPVAAGEELRDAVAGHATQAPASAALPASPSPIAPAAPSSDDSNPLLASCACAAAIGLGAYAFRRLRRRRTSTT